MRWQPHLHKAYKHSIRTTRSALALAGIGTAILLVGWANLVSQLAFRHHKAFLALADEPVSLLNIYQPCCIIFLAVLCLSCSKFEEDGQIKRSFLVLSAGFAILAIGEIQSFIQLFAWALPPDGPDWLAQLDIGSHSMHINRIRSFLGTENPIAVCGVLFVIPVVAGLVMSDFLASLPPRHAVNFFACGAVYVAGVLGMEAVSQLLAIEYGPESNSYIVTAGLEETLETIGLSGFALALAGYLRETRPRVEKHDLIGL